MPLLKFWQFGQKTAVFPTILNFYDTLHAYLVQTGKVNFSSSSSWVTSTWCEETYVMNILYTQWLDSFIGLKVILVAVMDFIARQLGIFPFSVPSD